MADWREEAESIDDEELKQLTSQANWRDEAEPIASLDEVKPDLEKARFKEVERKKLASPDQPWRDNYAFQLLYGPAVQTVNQAGSAMVRGAGIVADVVGADETAKALSDTADSMNRYGEAVDEVSRQYAPTEGIAGFADRASRSALGTFPTMAVSGGIGGMPGLLGTLGMQTYDRELTAARDAGLPEAEAQSKARMHALNEVAVTSVFNRFAPGLEGMFGKSGSEEVKKGFGAAVKRFAVTTGQELPEEIVVELLNNTINAAYGTDPQALSGENIASTIYETTAATIATVGLAQGVDRLNRGANRGTAPRVETGPQQDFQPVNADGTPMTPEQQINKSDYGSRETATRGLTKEQITQIVTDARSQATPERDVYGVIDEMGYLPEDADIQAEIDAQEASGAQTPPAAINPTPASGLQELPETVVTADPVATPTEQPSPDASLPETGQAVPASAVPQVNPPVGTAPAASNVQIPEEEPGTIVEQELVRLENELEQLAPKELGNIQADASAEDITIEEYANRLKSLYLDIAERAEEKPADPPRVETVTQPSQELPEYRYNPKETNEGPRIIPPSLLERARVNDGIPQGASALSDDNALNKAVSIASSGRTQKEKVEFLRQMGVDVTPTTETRTFPDGRTSEKITGYELPDKQDYDRIRAAIDDRTETYAGDLVGMIHQDQKPVWVKDALKKLAIGEKVSDDIVEAIRQNRPEFLEEKELAQWRRREQATQAKKAEQEKSREELMFTREELETKTFRELSGIGSQLGIRNTRKNKQSVIAAIMEVTGSVEAAPEVTPLDPVKRIENVIEQGRAAGREPNQSLLDKLEEEKAKQTGAPSPAQGSKEALARAVGDDPEKLQARLKDAKSVLADKGFGKGTFNFEDKTLTGDNGTVLEWRMRNDPDKPESYENQQTNGGIVRVRQQQPKKGLGPKVKPETFPLSDAAKDYSRPTTFRKNTTAAPVAEVQFGKQVRDDKAINGGSRKVTSTPVTIPGYEGYDFAITEPNGQKRKGTYSDGELIERSTGAAIVRRNPNESIEDFAKRLPNDLGRIQKNPLGGNDLDLLLSQFGDSTPKFSYEQVDSTEGKKPIFKKTHRDGEVDYVIDNRTEGDGRPYPHGDLAKTLDQAKENRDLQERQTKDRAEAKEKQKAREAEEAKAKAEAEDLDGFTDDMAPIQQKRIAAYMTERIRLNGKVGTRRDLARQMIDDGYAVAPDESWLAKDGTGWRPSKGLGKTFFDYARHYQAEKKAAKDRAEMAEIEAKRTPEEQAEVDSLFQTMEQREAAKKEREAKPAKKRSIDDISVEELTATAMSAFEQPAAETKPKKTKRGLGPKDDRRPWHRGMINAFQNKYGKRAVEVTRVRDGFKGVKSLAQSLDPSTNITSYDDAKAVIDNVLENLPKLMDILSKGPIDRASSKALKESLPQAEWESIQTAASRLFRSKVPEAKYIQMDSTGADSIVFDVRQRIEDAVRKAVSSISDNQLDRALPLAEQHVSDLLGLPKTKVDADTRVLMLRDYGNPEMWDVQNRKLVLLVPKDVWPEDFKPDAQKAKTPSQPSVKKSLSAKLKDAAETANDEYNATWKELGDLMDGTVSMNPMLDPRFQRVAAKLVVTGVKAKVLDFAVFIANGVEQIGVKNMRQLGPLLEASWQKVKDTYDIDGMDDAGNVEALLEDEVFEAEGESIPAYVVSGMQAGPKDIAAKRSVTRPIGIAVTHMKKKKTKISSDRVIDGVARHANRGNIVFLDSGMFNTVKGGEVGAEPNWQTVFEQYDRIIERVNDSHRSKLMIVAPDFLVKNDDGDVVGDTQKTLDLQERYKSQLQEYQEQGVSIIVPVQRDFTGELSLGAIASEATDIVDFSTGRVSFGIPYNAAAFPDNEILDFVRSSKGTGLRIHLLGGGKARAEKLWEKIKAIDPTVQVTGDSATEVRNRGNYDNDGSKVKKDENTREETNAGNPVSADAPDGRVDDSTGQSGTNAPAVSSGTPEKRGLKSKSRQQGGDVLPPSSEDGQSDAGNAGGSVVADSQSNQSELAGRDTANASGADDAQSVEAEDRKPVSENDKNHVIEDSDSIAVANEAKSLDRNIKAIRLLQKLEKAGRNPTPAEKKVLAQYTGWGGLSNAFDEVRGEPMVQNKPEWQRHQNWEKTYGKAYVTLKEILSKDEWIAARDTTVNAHYTSRDAIQPMWELVQRLGFKGGNVLEPGAGIGHFAGMMPSNLRRSSKFTMVEMDSLSSRIAKLLYPEADVFQSDLNDFKIVPGSVSLAIGNVPFLQSNEVDSTRRYGRPLNLHNYFIARALDAVEPGGLVVLISSNGTMDNQPDQRRFIATKGDLIGAIRLPNNAFKGNAKTDVVTDILVFRRPIQGEPKTGFDFGSTREITTKTKDGREVEHKINQYFADNPQMVLGSHSAKGSMYEADSYTVDSTPGKLSEKIEKAIEQFPQDIAGKTTATGSVADTSGEVASGRLEIRDGKVVMGVADKWVPLEEGRQAGFPAHLFGKTGIERAQDYIGLRSAYENLRKVMLNETASDDEVAQAQKVLNRDYDNYVKKHGFLGGGTKTSIFKRDPDYYRVRSLENRKGAYNDETKKIDFTFTKAEVFTKRTLGPNKPPTTASSPADAMWISLGYKGRIDEDYIGSMLGISPTDVPATLAKDGLVFRDPVTLALTPRNQYLSGNVRQKLDQAKVAVKEDASYQPNVEALEKAQPATVPIAKVSFRIGSTWIPETAMTKWVREILGSRSAKVTYNENTDSWDLRGIGDRDLSQTAREQFGTSRFNALEVIKETLNMRAIKVYDRVETGEYTDSGKPKTTRVLNEKETLAAKTKSSQLQGTFSKWVFRDEQSAVREEMEKSYNDKHNNFVESSHDGSHLTLPGSSESVTLRAYQKNAIARILQEGRALLAHTVGAGKTYTMIGAAMEMKRLGIARRPMIVVQNSTLGQFSTSFLTMYPNAKVLIASKDDLQKGNRQLFLAKVSSNDWDAVVIAQSTFDNMASYPEVEREYIQEQVDELEEAIKEEGGEGSKTVTVKQLVKSRKALQKKLESLVASRTENDDNVYYDDMGVDALFIDEAHAYKKPPFKTKLSGLKGLNTSPSERSLGTMIKVRTVQRSNNGKNVILATGTPVTNTLGEAWHMMNFVAPDVNEAFGVKSFDRFISSFAKVSPALVMNAGGGWDYKDTIEKFINGPELVQYIRTGWDVLTPADLKLFLEEDESGGLPELRGGKVEAVTVQRTPGVAQFMGFIEQVYKRFKEMPAKDRRELSYIPAIAYGAARAASMDIRLINPNAKEEAGSKTIEVVKRAMEIYEQSNATRGAQLIFSDTFNPYNVSNLYNFMEGQDVKLNIVEREDSEVEDEPDETSSFLYQELKKKLIAEGVPEKEIALIGDFKTDSQREALFERVNSGDIRFLIGSTPKMGVGVNVQKNLIALHHMDSPWLPADTQQRDGRIMRYGNANPEIVIARYAMTKSLDGAIFAANARKAKFIWQVLSGKLDGREFEDPTSELVMSIEEQLAAIQDNPLFFEKIEAQKELRELTMDRESFQDSQARVRTNLAYQSSELRDTITKSLPSVKERKKRADALAKAEPIDKFSMVLNGKPIADIKKAGEALKAEIQKRTDEIMDDITNNRPMKGYSTWQMSSAKGKPYLHFKVGPFEATVGINVRQTIEGGKPVWKTTYDSALNMPGENNIEIYAGSASTAKGLFEAVPKAMERLDEAISNTEQRIERLKKSIDENEQLVGRQWDGEDRIEQLQSRLAEIETEMLAAGSSISNDTPTPPSEAENTPDDPEEPTGNSQGYNAARRKSQNSKGVTPGFDAIDRTNAVLDSLQSAERDDRSEDAISKGQVLRTLERLFNTRFDKGRTPKVAAMFGKIEGVFRALDPNNNVSKNIRLHKQHTLDLAVASHELGHFIDRETGIASVNPRKRQVDIPRNLQNEVKRLDLTGENQLEEGFAEFVRIWLTEPNTMDVNGIWVTGNMAYAKNFTEWFEKTWMPANPDMEQKLKRARGYIKKFNDQSLFTEMRTMLGSRPADDLDFRERLSQLMHRSLRAFQRAMYDTNYTTRDIDRILRANGWEGMSIEEVMGRYMFSAIPEAMNALKYGVRDIRTTAKISNRGLWDRIGEQLINDVERDEAAEYALMRHTVFMDGVSKQRAAKAKARYDANRDAMKKRGQALPPYNFTPPLPYSTGVPVEKAQQFIDIIGKDPSQKARYEKIAEIISDFAHELLEMRVRAGGLSRESADRIIKRYNKNYFPMHRVMDKSHVKMSSMSNRSVLTGYYGVKGRSNIGSDAQVQNPFESLQRMAIEYYAAAGKARVNELLHEAIDRTEGSALIGVKVQPEMIRSTFEVSEVLKQFVDAGWITEDDARAGRIAGILRGVVAGVASNDDMKFFGARHGLDHTTATEQEMNDAADEEPRIEDTIALFRPDFTSNTKEQISVRYDRNGNKSLYQYDKEVYAMLAGLNGKHLNIVLKILKGMSKGFKMGTVGLSLTFGTMNMLKDYNTIQGRARYTPGLRSLSTPVKRLGIALKTRAQQAIGSDPKNMDSLQMFYDDVNGTTISIVGSDTTSMRTNYKKQLGKTWAARHGLEKGNRVRGTIGLATGSVGSVFNFLENAVALTDMPPRLAEMEWSIRRDGWAPGKGGMWINLKTGKERSGLPEDVVVRAITAAAEATVNFRRRGSVSSIIDIFLPFHVATINSKVKYASVLKNATTNFNSSNELDRNQARRTIVHSATIAGMALLYVLMRKDDDDYKKLPQWLRDKTWNFAINGRTRLRLAMSYDEIWIKKMVEDAVRDQETENPRGIAGVLEEEASDWLPKGGGPVWGGWEIARDWDYFKQRPVESGFEHDERSDMYKSNDRTTTIAKKLAPIFNNKNGDGLSPVQIDHLLDSATGGKYTDIVDFFNNLSEGKVELNDIPGIKGLTVNPNQAQDVYDLYDRDDSVARRKANADYLRQLAKDQGDTNAFNEADKEYKSALSENSSIHVYRDLMSSVSSEQRKQDDRYAFTSQLVGLSREAMGRRPLESDPSPFADGAKIPEELKPIIKDFVKDRLKKTLLGEDRPRSDSETKTKEVLTETWEARREADYQFLKKHVDSPIVREVFREAMRDDSVRGRFERITASPTIKSVTESQRKKGFTRKDAIERYQDDVSDRAYAIKIKALLQGR